MVTAALVLVSTACSGDGDASSDATITFTPPIDRAPISEPAVPATTRPVGTDPATVGTTEPAAAPSPVASPIAPDDETQAQQAVIDAAIASWTAFNELLLDPSNDAKVAALAATRTGDALTRAVEIAASYRAMNQRERTHREFPATVEVISGSVVIGDEGSAAIVEYCRLGSNIWVELGVGPDGRDRVIDDTINSYLERDTLTLVGDHWVKTGGVTQAKFLGAVSCLASG